MHLNLLRFSPVNAVRIHGFLMTIANVHLSAGGRCQLFPSYGAGNIITLHVILSPSGKDWFCPYQSRKSLCVAVPKGQPDGTLLVTPGMNGCALEVRENNNYNEFYHDYNGISMENGLHKFRLEASQYMCASHKPQIRLSQQWNATKCAVGNYTHSIICVKKQRRWYVYNNAVQTLDTYDEYTGNVLTKDAWHVKDGLPYELGSFLD